MGPLDSALFCRSGAYYRPVIPSPDMFEAASLVLSDARIVRAELLEGGSSALVVHLHLRSPDGTEHDLVFRQHADRASKGHDAQVAAKEFHLLSYLAEQGLAVPRPLALHGASTAAGPWLVTEMVAGSIIVDDNERELALTQMVAFLVRLHALDSLDIDVPGLEPIEDPSQVLHSYLPADAVGRTVARKLNAGVERHPNPTVLVHGDYWPGNIMFQHKKLVAVLDWEDAKWGDPLVDLACTRVELACAYGRDATQLFTKLYYDEVGPVEVYDLPLWDMYVSATALTAMHLWGLPHHVETARRQATRAFFEDAAAMFLTA
jgi:aminoglycoside phosphotransferase (APT) family kinase protein